MKQESPTKSKLLEVALEMIWASSYGSVSVDDICQRAGVNKGSFYHFFKSKSDLAVAAYERHWEEAQLRLDPLFSPLVPAEERITGYLRMLIEKQTKQFTTHGKMLGCPFCALGSELSTQDEAVRRKAEQIGQRMLRYFESATRDLVASGEVTGGTAVELAQEIYSFVMGTLMQAKIENSPRLLERLIPGVQRLLGTTSRVVAQV